MLVLHQPPVVVVHNDIPSLADLLLEVSVENLQGLFVKALGHTNRIFSFHASK
jgi:hypothetical protein